MSKPKFKFYATLLDSFQWYLESEQDEAFQEFIDKLNRVETDRSEKALKGMAFNDLVDLKELPPVKTGKGGPFYEYKGFKYDADIVHEIRDYFAGAASQVFVSAPLETVNGVVELYGYQDKVQQDTASDIKCTGSYDVGKYLKAWQHRVYGYCNKYNGYNVPRFEYIITDYNNTYKEDYVYDEAVHVPQLKSICGRLIAFIEQYRHLITDDRVFGGSLYKGQE